MTSLTTRIDNLERNLIINGNFDFWQRGTSQAFTSASTNLYLADRFFTNIGTAGYTFTTSRSTDVPTFAQSGFTSVYSMLVTNGSAVTVAANDNNSIGFKIEGNDYVNIHAKRARFQYWVKSSVAGTFPMVLRGGSPLRSYVTPLTITVANTWQKVIFDVLMDSVSGYSFDNSIGLRCEIYLTAGSTFQTSTLNTWQTGNFVGITGQTQWAQTAGATFQLAQVMLVPQDFSLFPSNVDVPFQRAGRTIAHELQMCQRYYQKSYDLGTPPGSIVTVNAYRYYDPYIGGVGRVTFYYQTRMRTTPLIVPYGIYTGSPGNVGNIRTTADVTATPNSGSGEIAGNLSISNNQNDLYQFHYTADAEL